jgi:hypothetical protein
MSGYAYACEYGCDESAAALIQAGCNKGIVNREGFTGEDRAREYATRGFNRTSVLAVIASTVASIASAIEVTFTDIGSLGLGFESDNPSLPARIKEVKPQTQAMNHPQLAPGMTLLAVGGVPINVYGQAIAAIKASGRPLTLAFAAPGGPPKPAAKASPQSAKKPAQRVAREATKLRGKSVLEDTEREKVMAAMAALDEENRMEGLEEGDEEEEESDGEEHSESAGASSTAGACPQCHGLYLRWKRDTTAPRRRLCSEFRRTAENAWVKVGSRYRCVRRSIVRDGFAMDSGKIGMVERGDLLTVMEKRVNEADTTRIRIARGWISATTSDGDNNVELLVCTPSPLPLLCCSVRCLGHG